MITSGDVTGALLTEVAGLARQVAPWTAALSIRSTSAGRSAEEASAALLDTSGLMWAAAAAITAGQARHSRSRMGTRLLAAVPANYPAPRCPPRGEESLPELCQRTIETAERLRTLAWSSARQSRWSPVSTSLTWRRSALGSAIVAHSSEFILRSLHARAAQLGVGLPTRRRLLAAANAMDRACDARRVLAGAWDILSTGAHPPDLVGPVAGELADLVLRTGRIAYHNPRWTPASGRGRLRDPSEIAQTRADLAGVFAAVHHAMDAIATLVAEDTEAVRTAAADGRIYQPTRNIPPGWRISRRYKHAPRPQVDALLGLYQAVTTADTAALVALDDLSGTLHTPSEMLGEARLLAQSRTAAAPRRTPGNPGEPAVDGTINADVNLPIVDPLARSVAQAHRAAARYTAEIAPAVSLGHSS